jgi:formate hydrogenlyase subunit 3/multisubunit Na+/H+ antiporter MnhD subunit
MDNWIIQKVEGDDRIDKNPPPGTDTFEASGDYIVPRMPLLRWLVVCAFAGLTTLLFAGVFLSLASPILIGPVTNIGSWGIGILLSLIFAALFFIANYFGLRIAKPYWPRPKSEGIE